MKYLIWSLEHNAWWGQHRIGYFKVRADAGRYKLAEALEICAKANRYGLNDDRPSEAILPDDFEEMGE